MKKYDYSKLRGKIKEIFNTQSEFADALNISSTTLSYKLNNQSDFTREELDRAIEILHLDKNEIMDIFFTKQVENNSTK